MKLTSHAFYRWFPHSSIITYILCTCCIFEHQDRTNNVFLRLCFKLLSKDTLSLVKSSMLGIMNMYCEIDSVLFVNLSFSDFLCVPVT